jgi:hypothetical protein
MRENMSNMEDNQEMTTAENTEPQRNKRIKGIKYFKLKCILSTRDVKIDSWTKIS